MRNNKMEPNFLPLLWDSGLFGFNVCRIENSIKGTDDLKSVELTMEKGSYKLAYHSSPYLLKMIEIPTLEVKLVDKKTTYVKETNGSLLYHSAVKQYASDTPSIKLLNLAVQSGKYSRFNIDKNIDNKKFEELYRIWITRSVRKEIASEVFVYSQGKGIAGCITVGQKYNRADVGLVAVDSQQRGKGIGKAMMQHAEKWVFDNGQNEIQVVTQGDNTPACRLYEHLGYTRDTVEFFYHIWRK
jgi:dTDP-4-amino-4,6-dideoxy-D-galactose acyltransferase